MSTPIRGNIKMALASIRSSKMRSMLTMMGVIIGIVSVVTVVSIGEGVKQQVGGQIDQLGHDLITVRPGQLSQHNPSFGLLPGPGSLGSLSQQDLEVIQKTPHVAEAVPLALVDGTVKVEKRSYGSQTVMGTTNGLEDILKNPIAYGEFFGEDVSSQPNVAIIGQNVAKDLFKQRVPLGHNFEFLGQSFVVLGIFNEFDTAPLSLSTDFNNTIFIPYQTAQVLTNENTRMYEILAKPTGPGKLDPAVQGITQNLKEERHGQQQFTVLSQDDNLAVTNNILELLTRLIAGIAAISLFVGGVGIMNVMLVSVTERMHEIGIRKALGATNRQILTQFLVEAGVLSMIGGIIGVVLSLIVVFVLHVFTPLAPIVTWQVVALATGVSLLVGTVFGSVPALKAARKDPIEALRNE